MGCEPFSPFEESDRYFSVYGWLDMRKEVQIVRVIPVRQTPALPRRIDARVQVRDQMSGEMTVWTDSLVEGTPPAFLFYRRFLPRPGHRYRLEVSNTMGRTTVLEVLLPPRPEVHIPNTWHEDAHGRLFQEVIVYHPEGVFEAAEVRYRVSDGIEPAPREIRIPYPELRWHEGKEETVLTLAWELDRQKMLEQLGMSDSSRIVLHNVQLVLTLVDPLWDRYRSTGEQPSTTRNGFGVVAGITRYDTTWLPPQAVADSLNYELERTDA